MAVIKTIELSSWQDFEAAIRDIYDRRQKLEEVYGRDFESPGCVVAGPKRLCLFRGIGDSRYRLETTLERAYDVEAPKAVDNLLTYYERVARMRPGIEAHFSERWTIPTVEVFSDGLQNLPPAHLTYTNASVMAYLIYLRHHQCPSPLLDWSTSAYVAAFFAFDNQSKGGRRATLSPALAFPNS
jgi:hypothetical protein